LRTSIKGLRGSITMASFNAWLLSQRGKETPVGDLAEMLMGRPSPKEARRHGASGWKKEHAMTTAWLL
jgi:hypothetical protein